MVSTKDKEASGLPRMQLAGACIVSRNHLEMLFAGRRGGGCLFGVTYWQKGTSAQAIAQSSVVRKTIANGRVAQGSL